MIKETNQTRRRSMSVITSQSVFYCFAHSAPVVIFEGPFPRINHAIVFFPISVSQRIICDTLFLSLTSFISACSHPFFFFSISLLSCLHSRVCWQSYLSWSVSFAVLRALYVLSLSPFLPSQLLPEFSRSLPALAFPLFCTHEESKEEGGDHQSTQEKHNAMALLNRGTLPLPSLPPSLCIPCHVSFYLALVSLWYIVIIIICRRR